MKLLARQMVVREVVKCGDRGKSFAERIDMVIKGAEIRNNTALECLPGGVKETIICSMLLVLEMGCKGWVRAEPELGLDLLGNPNHHQILRQKGTGVKVKF